MKNHFIVARAWYSAHVDLSARLSVRELFRIFSRYDGEYRRLVDVADCLQMARQIDLTREDRAHYFLALIYRGYTFNPNTDEERSSAAEWKKYALRHNSEFKASNVRDVLRLIESSHRDDKEDLFIGTFSLIRYTSFVNRYFE